MHQDQESLIQKYVIPHAANAGLQRAELQGRDKQTVHFHICRLLAHVSLHSK